MSAEAVVPTSDEQEQSATIINFPAAALNARTQDEELIGVDLGRDQASRIQAARDAVAQIFDLQQIDGRGTD